MHGYDYFEERPWGQKAKKRQRNLQFPLHPGVTRQMMEQHSATNYVWWKTREFEGRGLAHESEGVWPINHSRVHRHGGDPGTGYIPWGTTPDNWPANVAELARRFRLHHYFRVRDVNQIRLLTSQDIEVRVALEVTKEWYDPPDGVIEIPDSSPSISVHAVPIGNYDPSTDRLLFPNSWGEEWGKHGRGSIASSAVSRYMTEAWCIVTVHPLFTSVGGVSPLRCASSER